ncbi:hypothetical protein EYF80_010992 [Liparis tanakae]|uniref:Uncharacterized protein n=1 Tax=Liparis tanakae TaxID=230148 RepID=A0A4Z2INL3_9TELE|nr:hypothetical protein EYF80_010992 [Liparis tanakae]
MVSTAHRLFSSWCFIDLGCIASHRLPTTGENSRLADLSPGAASHCCSAKQPELPEPCTAPRSALCGHWSGGYGGVGKKLID